MHRQTHALRRARTIYPAAQGDEAASSMSLEELAASLLSPDDMPLEIEDLAPHFLMEATQSTFPSSAPRAAEPVPAEGEDAALREAFFEDADNREKLREFERIWKHIISREVSSTEL